MKRQASRNRKPARRRRHAKPVKAKSASPSRTPRPQAEDGWLGALVSASVRALGLELEADWQDSVTFNLRLILSHAARVDEFALPEDAEPAPIFHA
jgi:hypothetical protein